MNNIFLVNALEKYFQTNRSNLLSKEDILEQAKKAFSTSGFSLYSKDNVDKVMEKESVIFAFKEGILFTDKFFYYFDIGKMQKFEYKDFLTIEANHKTLMSFGRLKINGADIAKESSYKFNIEGYEFIKGLIKKADIENKNESERLRLLELEEAERKRVEELNLVSAERNSLYKNLSPNKEGTPEILDINSFSEILEKSESKIAEKDSKYILQFVRLSSFLKSKRESVISLYNEVNRVETMDDLKTMYPLLEEQNQVLNQVLYYSINMVTSLIDGKMILFYSIYEKFDKLGVFNSQWEKDLKENLQSINTNLIHVIQSINQMERNLSNELWNLGQELSDSINNMGATVSAQLQKTNSKLDYNNLVATINAYQNYKTNKKLSS